MSYSEIAVDTPAEHVRRVTLSRPDHANAINKRMLAEILDAVEDIAADDSVHVWLLRGAPRRDGRPWFSAGADMKEALSPPVDATVDGADVCDRIDALLKPSIAVIGGVCTTGALELALACDLRVAGQSAVFSDYHLVRSGLGIGAWGLAPRLSRLVGVDKAKELLLLSSDVPAPEAQRIGLVNHVVDDAALDEETFTIATRIASMPRRGVRATLGFLQEQAGLGVHDAQALARRFPELMGIRLRPFSDAASRFYTDRTGSTPPAAP
ncbi:enoyl-CoA hydratase/isomerase family protein [Streptomyces sp. NPDC057253]|uniref:enoyl-CoA hydratase/isomerase family protein n=1 Tax=Streptomyces sp. NPDC057253 TaxID=3346069 RepID=UPI00363D6136